MAIRFLCPLCGQPVEIDDPWAGKLVACPFCRKTVTAPPQSTLALEDAVPMAAPFAGTPPDAWPGATAPPGLGPAEAVQPRNTVALVAALMAVVSLAAYMAAGVVLVQNLPEVLGGDPRGTNMTPGDMNRAVQQYLAKQTTPPGWMITVMLLFLLSAMAWLTAVVCGVIGLGRRRRRGFAIAALCLCGCMMLLGCLGALASLAG